MEFLRPKDVTKKMKISRPWLHILIRENLFPKPIKLTYKIKVWKDDEVEKIMNAMFNNEGKEKIRDLVRQIENSRNN